MGNGAGRFLPCALEFLRRRQEPLLCLRHPQQACGGCPHAVGRLLRSHKPCGYATHSGNQGLTDVSHHGPVFTGGGHMRGAPRREGLHRRGLPGEIRVPHIRPQPSSLRGVHHAEGGINPRSRRGLKRHNRRALGRPLRRVNVRLRRVGGGGAVLLHKPRIVSHQFALW